MNIKECNIVIAERATAGVWGRSPQVQWFGSAASHLSTHTSHFTPHTSHLLLHTSHLTSYLTHHTSHFTPQTSHLAPHTPHLIPIPNHPIKMLPSNKSHKFNKSHKYTKSPNKLSGGQRPPSSLIVGIPIKGWWVAKNSRHPYQSFLGSFLSWRRFHPYAHRHREHWRRIVLLAPRRLIQKGGRGTMLCIETYNDTHIYIYVYIRHGPPCGTPPTPQNL